MSDNDDLPTDFESVPGTWAFELKNHWDAFSDLAWRAFDKYVDSTRGLSLDKMKWREYLLWDMCRRHKEEVKNGK
jgi:hypothetical protein